MGFFQEINRQNIFGKGNWLNKANLLLLSANIFIFAAIFGMMLMEYPYFFSSPRVFAAQDWKTEKEKEAVFPIEEGKISQSILDASDSVKGSVKAYKAQQLARKRAAAARVARAVLSSPALTGPTEVGPGGLRVCTRDTKPQGGNKPHVDEDCCPDPDEYPNPRCYYSPSQMSILKKR